VHVCGTRIAHARIRKVIAPVCVGAVVDLQIEGFDLDGVAEIGFGGLENAPSLQRRADIFVQLLRVVFSNRQRGVLPRPRLPHGYLRPSRLERGDVRRCTRGDPRHLLAGELDSHRSIADHRSGERRLTRRRRGPDGVAGPVASDRLFPQARKQPPECRHAS
jgi:hypothetical protein